MKSIPVSYAPRKDCPRDFVRMFGHVMACGAAMDLHRFAVSYYLQGCEDMAQAAVKEMTKCEP